MELFQLKEFLTNYIGRNFIYDNHVVQLTDYKDGTLTFTELKIVKNNTVLSQSWYVKFDDVDSLRQFTELVPIIEVALYK